MARLQAALIEVFSPSLQEKQTVAFRDSDVAPVVIAAVGTGSRLEGADVAKVSASHCGRHSDAPGGTAVGT